MDSKHDNLFGLQHHVLNLGTEEYGTQIQKFSPLQTGGSCTSLSPALCTGVAIDSLDWDLHGFHVYYVTVKATNRAMLSTQAVSPPYEHGIQKVTAGIVIEIPPAVRRYTKFQKNYQF